MDLSSLNILLNEFDLPMIQQISIEGPISVSEWYSDYLDKHIYIFGDMHVNEKHCADPDTRTIHIQKFLEWTFDTYEDTDKNIDFYCETQFHSRQFRRTEIGFGQKRLSPIKHYLNDINSYFKDCFEIDKTKCRYKNTRFHYVDVRFFPDSVLVDITLLLSDIINFNTNMHKEDFIEKLLPTIKPTLENLYQRLLNTTIHDIFTEMKITKQFQNIPYPLRNYVENYWYNLCQKYLDILVINVKEMLTSDGINQKYNTAQLFVFPGLIMDAYTMGRVFRDFNGKSQNYVIIYIGDWHKSNYDNFLAYLKLFKLVTSARSDEERKNFQCLKSGLHLPLFS